MPQPAERCGGDPAGDGEGPAILGKMVRQRHESARAHEEGGRLELVGKELAEIGAVGSKMKDRLGRPATSGRVPGRRSRRPAPKRWRRTVRPPAQFDSAGFFTSAVEKTPVVAVSTVTSTASICASPGTSSDRTFGALVGNGRPARKVWLSP